MTGTTAWPRRPSRIARKAAPARRGRPSGPRRRTIHGAHVIGEKMKCASEIMLEIVSS
ncbi:hypothetical protein C7S17_5528 [Burkholderia thailandensis]|nr:hypothetical protein [Burkholderia thailandensis]